MTLRIPEMPYPPTSAEDHVDIGDTVTLPQLEELIRKHTKAGGTRFTLRHRYDQIRLSWKLPASPEDTLVYEQELEKYRKDLLVYVYEKELTVYNKAKSKLKSNG